MRLFLKRLWQVTHVSLKRDYLKERVAIFLAATSFLWFVFLKTAQNPLLNVLSLYAIYACLILVFGKLELEEKKREEDNVNP